MYHCTLYKGACLGTDNGLKKTVKNTLKKVSATYFC